MEDLNDTCKAEMARVDHISKVDLSSSVQLEVPFTHTV